MERTGLTPQEKERILNAVEGTRNRAMLTLGFAGLGFLGYRRTKAGVSASAAA